jgi:hypothetical protein
MKFTLEIELGNELMQNKAHLAHALHGVASRIVNFNHTLSGEESGRIPDENGNTVGSWQITEPNDDTIAELGN